MNQDTYEMLMDVRGYCKRTGCQMCHICDDMSCGDNDNPLAQRIKVLEKALKEYQTTKEDCLGCTSYGAGYAYYKCYNCTRCVTVKDNYEKVN
jgi:hypothetical protein